MTVLQYKLSRSAQSYFRKYITKIDEITDVYKKVGITDFRIWFRTDAESRRKFAKLSKEAAENCTYDVIKNLFEKRGIRQDMNAGRMRDLTLGGGHEDNRVFLIEDETITGEQLLGGKGELKIENVKNMAIIGKNFKMEKVSLHLENVEEFILSGINITKSSYPGGVQIKNSKKNTITNNTFDNGSFGIHFFRSNNNTIAKNICKDNTSSGVDLYSSNENTIMHNTFKNNNIGIIISKLSKNNAYLHNRYRDNKERIHKIR